MKIVFAAMLVVFVAASGVAQSEQAGPARERIQAAKIGVITNRLSLTSEQATRFWPLYNEFEDKKTDIRQAMRRLKIEQTATSATDDEIRSDLKEMLDLRQKQVDLEKEYTYKFLKVITPRQVAELYKAEQEFTRMMLERLEQRRGGQRNGTRRP